MAELTNIQQKALALFAKSSLKEKFYWTGGTLLATVYLKHRMSEDLDFFADKPFLPQEVADFAEGLIKPLRLKTITRNKIYDRWEFFLENKEKLKIEFVLYEHQRIVPTKKWQGIFIDSLEDISANKVMAMFDRNNPKDLVDIYFLLTKKKIKVETLLARAKRKFGFKIDAIGFWSETLKSLRSIDKIRPFLLAKDKEKLIENIKDYFKKQAALCLHSIID